MAFSNLALAPGAVEGPENYYLQDTATASLTHLGTITEVGDNSMGLGSFPFRATTPNGDHVLFESLTALTPDAIAGSNNLYLFSESGLEVVNRRPDGTVDPDLATVGGESGIGFNPLSDDGDRIFIGGNDLPLYVREGGDTRPISVSRRSGDPTTPVNARFSGASQDGAVVYFTAFAPLTDDAPPTNFRSLYRYDLEDDELSYVTMDDAPIPATDALGVVGMSDDGSYVYFTGGELASENRNLWVHHDGETRLIARVDDHLTQSISQVNATTSSDGTKFAFATSAPDLAGVPTTAEGEQCADHGGDCVMVYVYDATAADDPLRCASCPPSGAHPTADAAFDQTPDDAQGRIRRRTLLDDGRVFFDTAEALLPDDVNETADVYRWHDGELTLVSPGTPGHESRMGTATPDGRSVFFFTDAPLVGQDRDSMFDTYVARVGGGIPGQSPPSPPAPCSGDVCRGPVASPPTREQPASDADRDGEERSQPRPRAALGRISARARRALAKRGRATIAVRVNRAGRVALVARMRVRGRTVLAGRVVRRAGRAGIVRMTLRLREPVRRRLARGHSVRLALEVRFAGALDRPRTTLTLDRKGR